MSAVGRCRRRHRPGDRCDADTPTRRRAAGPTARTRRGADRHSTSASRRGATLPPETAAGGSRSKSSWRRRWRAGRPALCASTRPATISDVLIRFSCADGVLTAEVPRNRLYSSTTYIFVLWMVGSSLVLLAVAGGFSAQSGKIAAPAGGGGRRVRQGPSGAVLQGRGRPRGPAGGGRLYADARPHPAPDPPAHRDARRRVARSAHAADPHEAGAGDDRRRSGRRRN